MAWVGADAAAKDAALRGFKIENGKDAGPVCMDNLESFIASMQ